MSTIYILMFLLIAVAGISIAYIVSEGDNPYIAIGLALSITIVFVSIFALRIGVMEKEEFVKEEIIEQLGNEQRIEEHKEYTVELNGVYYEVKLRKNTKGEYEVVEMNTK